MGKNDEDKKTNSEGLITIEVNCIPPSANHQYYRSKNKRMFMVKDQSDFKEGLELLQKAEKMKRGYKQEEYIIEQNTFFYIDFYFWFTDKRFPDPQNLLKLQVDQLEKQKLFKNDKYQLVRIQDVIIDPKVKVKTKIVILEKTPNETKS